MGLIFFLWFFLFVKGFFFFLAINTIDKLRLSFFGDLYSYE